jgi:CBS domain-containing protein
MTHQPATAQAGWPLTQAVALMVELGVNRLPVVDDGRPIRIVARDDVLRAVAARSRRPTGRPGAPPPPAGLNRAAATDPAQQR